MIPAAAMTAAHAIHAQAMISRRYISPLLTNILQQHIIRKLSRGVKLSDDGVLVLKDVTDADQAIETIKYYDLYNHIESVEMELPKNYDIDAWWRFCDFAKHYGKEIRFTSTAQATMCCINAQGYFSLWGHSLRNFNNYYPPTSIYNDIDWIDAAAKATNWYKQALANMPQIKYYE